MTDKFTAQERKERPVYSGVLKYFPDALLEVAHLSKVGNDQHNPGQPLHWAKDKSTDHLDAMTRHALEAGTRDTDGERHSAKVAWRALANLQMEIEREREAAKAQVVGGGVAGNVTVYVDPQTGRQTIVKAEDDYHPELPHQWSDNPAEADSFNEWAGRNYK